MIKGNFYFLLFACVLSLAACASTCLCRNSGATSADGSAGILIFLDMPVVEARTADDPVKTVFLSLSLGYYREEVGAEIGRNRTAVAEAAGYAVTLFRAADLNTVEGYEHLRRAIIARLNGMLVSGRVERVVIRSISVR